MLSCGRGCGHGQRKERAGHESWPVLLKGQRESELPWVEGGWLGLSGGVA